MNILLDFLTIQWKNGGGEYTRRVYFELFRKLKEEGNDAVKLFALWDSSQGIAYEDLREEALRASVDITFIDLYGRTLSSIISECCIDRFFIAMSQVLGDYPDIDLENVLCEVFCVTHDVCNEERYYNQMDYYYKFSHPKYQFENRPEPGWKIYFRWKDSTPRLVRWLIQIRRDRLREKTLASMQRVMSLYHKNPRVHLIAVSEYTKKSLQYNFGIPANDIQVLWSPERIYAEPKESVENEILRGLIEKRKKIYLLVNANRPQKNPFKAVHAFEKYASLKNDGACMLALGYQEKAGDCIVTIPWLSDSDLANAYKHCYAMVYPSFFEGFGYPPLEAMHYGKPVLCSNATSMPGIFGDAPIWFSPLYETAVFEALNTLDEENYDDYALRSMQQYERIQKRQKEDLDLLIKRLLN